MRRLLLAFVLVGACHHGTPAAPAPIVPDLVYTAMGPVPVVVVDTIGVPDSSGFVLGRYDFRRRVIYVRRSVTSPIERRRIIEHERCHLFMIESGLHNHTAPWYLEILCDSFAAAVLAELQREKGR